MRNKGRYHEDWDWIVFYHPESGDYCCIFEARVTDNEWLELVEVARVSSYEGGWRLIEEKKHESNSLDM